MTHFEHLMMLSGGISIAFAIYMSAVDPTKTPVRIMAGYYVLGASLLLIATSHPTLPVIGSTALLVVLSAAIYYTVEQYHIRPPKQVIADLYVSLNRNDRQ